MSRYIFGPIASRRLGRSLGVDLVRAKTCSLDCVYCEAGSTTCHTLERTEAVPVDDVIAETGLTTGKVLGLLTMLELKKVIRRHPGKRISLD